MPLNMGNFNQPPPTFGFLDQVGETVHPVVKFCLAALGSIGGYFYASSHHVFVAFPVIIGFIVGLLAVPLLLLLGKGLLGLLIVAAVAVAAFYLFQMSVASQPSAPVPAAAPAHQSGPPRSDDALTTAWTAAALSEHGREVSQ